MRPGGGRSNCVRHRLVGLFRPPIPDFLSAGYVVLGPQYDLSLHMRVQILEIGRVSRHADKEVRRTFARVVVRLPELIPSDDVALNLESPIIFEIGVQIRAEGIEELLPVSRHRLREAA